jgi:hypothetical protein
LAAPAIVLELSTNQRTWRVIMGASNDGGIPCTSWGLSSTTLSCILLNESARYLRITTNDSSVNIYEVDATGKMTVSAPAS